MVGGEIYVKKIPSMKVVDIAKTIAPHARHKVVGIRPGEKLHEQMIGEEDSYYTYEYSDYYKILPAINRWAESPERIKDGVRVAEGFSYTSQNNPHWMTGQELQSWIDLNRKKIGNF
jgi:FlaA1/EpsC-like NDP-sugar epimerase